MPQNAQGRLSAVDADGATQMSQATQKKQDDTAPLKSPAVQVRKLTRTFGGRRVLDSIDFDIDSGEFVALLGRSGSGKSTLLRALAGLDAVSPDAVRVPSQRAVVFQEPRLAPWKTVAENVALGLRVSNPRDVVSAALTEVGIVHRIDAFPATLSGGESQRAALARALVRNPTLLLMDEPFAALDALTRMQMQALIGRLWRAHHATILLVTHDVDEALLLADRVLVLDDGRIGTALEVPLPRPRKTTDPAFALLRDRLLAALGVSLEGDTDA